MSGQGGFSESNLRKKMLWLLMLWCSQSTMCRQLTVWAIEWAKTTRRETESGLRALAAGRDRSLEYRKMPSRPGSSCEARLWSFGRDSAPGPALDISCEASHAYSKRRFSRFGRTPLHGSTAAYSSWGCERKVASFSALVQPSSVHSETCRYSRRTPIAPLRVP